MSLRPKNGDVSDVPDCSVFLFSHFDPATRFDVCSAYQIVFATRRPHTPSLTQCCTQTKSIENSRFLCVFLLSFHISIRLLHVSLHQHLCRATYAYWFWGGRGRKFKSCHSDQNRRFNRTSDFLLFSRKSSRNLAFS